ncbi:MAG: ATP-dependent Clp protease ATP-binding subunit [Prolixibacteraceae bacterium]|jgi:ATP-dependent Clp protease ATP-binding subunit ClpA|nr:ATP-dependent Clp protease ATP-binding subunit [Prolixibacteraceae bacterium]
MNSQDYSTSLDAALKKAARQAQREQYNSFGVSHLMLVILNEPTGLREILESMGKDVAYISEWFEVRKEMYVGESNTIPNECDPDSELRNVLDEAERSKIKIGAESIDALCVFTAVVREGVVFSAAQIESLEVTEKELLDRFNVGLSAKTIFSSEKEQEVLTSLSHTLYTLLTNEIIEEGAQVIGREKEVRIMVENLQRSEQKGILVVGDSGVGKSALIKSFVNYMDSFEDEMFDDMMILGLNIHQLLSSCDHDGEIPQKLLSLLEKLNKLDRPKVLIIDNWETLLECGSGKSKVLANIFSSQLAESSIQFIFTITNDAYCKHIENHTLNSKLEILELEELDDALMMECLRRHKVKLQKHYSIQISDEVLEKLIYLSQRYFKRKKLPYGAIDLLDRTIASVSLSNKRANKELQIILERCKGIEKMTIEEVLVYEKIIKNQMGVVLLSKLTRDYDFSEEQSEKELYGQLIEFINELLSCSSNPIDQVTSMELEVVVAELTGIPIGKIQAGEKEKLLNIDSYLSERVKGQTRAISTLSDAIIESRSGLSNPKQPIGSFFFLGPTGTGKTELTKSLAELLFDDENAMIRFDMSEFKEEHSAALLYGAPPGYVGYEEGGMLVNKIRQKPYSVVLFDEIEKAHASVYDVFLQIMDEGVIHDKLGRDGDFSNAIIIFTSNIGSQWIVDQIRGGRTPSSSELIDVMSPHFRPEFLGRLTEVVPFSPIDLSVAMSIFRLQLSRLQKQLLEQKDITLELSEEALQYLSKKGFSEKYGARPIAGVVRSYIKKVISKFIVSAEVKEGDRILLDYKDENLIWEQF